MVSVTQLVWVSLVWMGLALADLTYYGLLTELHLKLHANREHAEQGAEAPTSVSSCRPCSSGMPLCGARHLTEEFQNILLAVMAVMAVAERQCRAGRTFLGRDGPAIQSVQETNDWERAGVWGEG